MRRQESRDMLICKTRPHDLQWTGIPIESFHSYRYRKIQLLFVLFNPTEELLETNICVRDVKLF